MIKASLFAISVALVAACGASSSSTAKGHVVVTETKVEIYDHIAFTPGTDQMIGDSDKILAAVATTLNDNPEIQLVSVQAYTGPEDGDTPEARKDLGTKRAKAVHDSLVTRGVAAERLSYETIDGPPSRMAFMVVKRSDSDK